MSKPSPAEKTDIQAKLSKACLVRQCTKSSSCDSSQCVSIVLHWQKKKKIRTSVFLAKGNGINCMIWRNFLILTQLKHYGSFCDVILYFFFFFFYLLRAVIRKT